MASSPQVETRTQLGSCSVNKYSLSGGPSRRHYSIVAKSLVSGGRLSPIPALLQVVAWLITSYSPCLSFPISKLGLMAVLDV